MPVDLHVHSTASDGTLSPSRMVGAAADRGLCAVALADHDTVAGVPEALSAGRERGIDVMPAVEIGTYYGGKEVHILGYLIRPEHQELLSLLTRVRHSRMERAEKIVARLNGLGVPLLLSDVMEICRGESLGRPHVAAALVAGGYVPDAQTAFERYLRRGRSAYVPRFRPPAADAIALIRDAGGIAVIAHPGIGNAGSAIPALVEAGLAGLEAYHVDHTPDRTRRLLQIASALGLLVTGGSDSHGPGGPKPVEVGAVQVPDDCADGLRRWGEKHGAWPPPEWPEQVS